MTEQIRWARINNDPFEYAIQQGPHGDEFVKLLDGSCLHRALPDPAQCARCAAIDAALGPCTQAELDGMDSKDAQLLQLWCERAMKAEGALSALSSTDRGDCAHQITVTPHNGAPHGAGFACSLSGGHCLPKEGCGYSAMASTNSGGVA